MHHCFPNCHLHLINFAPGTCGSLITSIVYYMLFPDQELISEQKFSNAHDTLHRAVASTWSDDSMIGLGWDIENYRQVGFTLPVINVPAGVNAYERIQPKDKNGYVLVIDHGQVYNYHSLSSVYPKFTQFLVTIKPEDRDQLDFNIFLKFHCQLLEGDELSKAWRNTQNLVVKKNSSYDWIYEYTTPKSLLDNTEHFNLFVKCHFDNPVDLTYMGNYDYRNYDTIISKNPKHKDCIHSIDFKTIMTDSESILNQVSSILEVPITNNARLVYDRWLSKQVLLESFLDK